MLQHFTSWLFKDADITDFGLFIVTIIVLAAILAELAR